jgi:AbiU2
VFTLTTRIWRDSTDERGMMERISPSFFLDMGQVLAEYVVLAACRITDPANNGKNFTIEYFVDCFSPNSTKFHELEQLEQIMYKLRDKIKPARNKLVAHADSNAIRKGIPLGYATWQE